MTSRLGRKLRAEGVSAKMPAMRSNPLGFGSSQSLHVSELHGLAHDAPRALEL
jgi:hypothetical protein